MIVICYNLAMLQKKFRLKNRNAFNATYKIKNSYHQGGITLFCGREKEVIDKCNNDATINNSKQHFPTKIGFVVSKKIHKRAVKRNRIKRLMRESVRLYIKSKGNNFDTKYISMIFVSSSKLLDKDFNYINNNIRKLMETVK